MKTTKLAGLAAVAMLVGTLAACNPSKPEFAILVPSADHGWTGAILRNAQTWADEHNTEDAPYEYEVYTSDDGEDQITQYEDLAGRGKNQIAAVVTLPWDNTVENGLNILAQSGIPFLQVDRVISNDTIANSEGHIGDVRGNNEMIGELTAERFLAEPLSLTKEDKILVMPGDNSTVPIARNNGFRSVLKENNWTDAEIDAAITSTDFTGWSRDTAHQLFVDWINTTADISAFRFVFTHDSEISLGILEALASNEIETAKKEAFKASVDVIASSSGLEEMYQVIRGNHERQAEYDAWVGEMDLFDVTYPPAMIVTGIEDMMNYLTEGTPVPGNGDHVVAVEVVDEAALKADSTLVGF